MSLTSLDSVIRLHKSVKIVPISLGVSASFLQQPDKFAQIFVVVELLLVACGMNVGWTLAGRGLDTGWTCSGQVVLGQPTSSPPPVHVTACWTFNGPYCTSRRIEQPIS